MSERNGDRARFHRERQRRILRRKRVRELRKTLAQGSSAHGASFKEEHTIQSGLAGGIQ
jgi:hypothetical protein